MIKHIVLWKLKPEAENASAEENGKKIVALFKTLEGKVPGLVSIESGMDFNRSPAAWDIGLVTSFKNKADLNFYQDFPAHVAIKQFIGKVSSERCVLDYEV
ncbi:MAG: Dabb family protein [Fibrobacteraceae bacterium]